MSVCRAVQHPGEFLVVFPKTFTSYICSGYSVSESVYFAPRDYLDLAEDEFRAIRESCEPMMFPLPRLLLAIAQDEVTTRATLRRVRPFLERMRDNEYVKRTMLSDLGVKGSERIVLRTKKQDQEDEYECEICSENLYVSYVSTKVYVFRQIRKIMLVHFIASDVRRQGGHLLLHAARHRVPAGEEDRPA